jgi:hypothetical protein
LLIEIDERIISAYKEKLNILDQEKKFLGGKKFKRNVFKNIYQQHDSPSEIVIQLAIDSAKLIPELEMLYNTIREEL